MTDLAYDLAQLNLTKTKEIVFRRASVNFDVLPQQLSNVERLACVRLLGIYVDSSAFLWRYAPVRTFSAEDIFFSFV